MKIIFIAIGVITLSIIGGLIAVSTMDITITQENIRKEIVIERPSTTPAPTPISVQ